MKPRWKQVKCEFNLYPLCEENYSREAPSLASFCSSHLGSADVAPKLRRRVRISVRVYIHIYLDGCAELGSDWYKIKPSFASYCECRISSNIYILHGWVILPVRNAPIRILIGLAAGP